MTDTPGWARAKLGGVRKSQILDPQEGSPLFGLHKRMVDCVCRCGARLAMVTDEPAGPSFTVWYPTVMVRRSNEGEPFWTIQAGDVPADGDQVVLHCFEHGHGSLAGSTISEAVNKYRLRGRTVRLVVENAGAE